MIPSALLSVIPKRIFFPWENYFSAARNYAIKRASGDWILAVDADQEVECKI
ncbi:glycosyltransferase [Desulfosporosinus shakirovi]|uniref:glycosyltransferase n=1 Tax=Desulfosporosinus shakirovi TaxID=2885154 RepID=UPI00249F8E00|nr:glycosyltransferase [Desulfosporosinus sp. SRJS8]